MGVIDGLITAIGAELISKYRKKKQDTKKPVGLYADEHESQKDEGQEVRLQTDSEPQKRFEGYKDQDDLMKK